MIIVNVFADLKNMSNKFVEQKKSNDFLAFNSKNKFL